MPPIKGAFRNYSEDAMKAASEDVKLRKMPIRTAARKFGVPKITLKYKVEGKSPIERNMRPPPILSKMEEDEISQWIEKMAAAGFPIIPDELITSVQCFIKKVKRANPFKNDRPGKTWVKAFLRRNSTVSKRISQSLTVSHASVTNTELQNWFSGVYNYLKEHSFEKILDDPSRIFNCDETVFFLNPKDNKVLVKKGAKTVYQQVNADEKECITALLICSASGLVAPTTVLFKYTRTPQEIVRNFPKEWGLGKSDSGWMTCEAFFKFIANMFHPWLIKVKVTLPVILFIDGHVLHLSLQTSQFCEKNCIILVALYLNAIHLRQPLDVAVFRILKEGWKKKVHEWRLQNLDAPTLRKKDFPKFLKEVIDNTVNESILCNGFRKCGLYLWNPLAVKIPEQEKEIEISTETQLPQINYFRQGLQFLNDNIELEKLNTFQCSSEQWSGDPQDRSLFMLLKKTQIELEKLFTSTEKHVNDETAVLPLDEDAEDERSLNADIILALPFLEEDNPSEKFLNNNAISNNVSPSPEQYQNTDGNFLSHVNTSNSDDVPCTSSSHTIPSPCENHFYYSGIRNQNIKKKKIAKERMPSVVSGELFQKYVLNKMKKK
ncbi:MFS-type transporter clz9 [Anthophora plagiata]